MTSTAIRGTVASPQERYNDNAIEHTLCVIVNPVLPYRERHPADSALSVAQFTSRLNPDNLGALFVASDELIDAGRKALTEVGDPERRNDPSEDIHRVMGTQNQHRCHFKHHNQYCKRC